MTWQLNGISRRVAAFAFIYGALSLSAAYAAPLSIVVIGDSNIEGKGVSRPNAFPAQLERALRARGLDVRVTNAGKNGDTTSGVLARLDSDVPNGTTLAIVSVGVNDVVLHHQSSEQARARVAEIAARLKARGIRVLVMPTGKAFQGPIADDPKFHVEAQGGATGPAAGTTNWHLTPEGYAQVVERTLPQVIAALNGSQ